MVDLYKNFIGGAWVDSESRKSFESFNPANTKDIIGIAPRSTKKDVDRAVAAAHAAYPSWSRHPAPKRGALLYKVAQLLEANKSSLGDLVTREMGKVKKEGHADVQEAIDMAYYMAGEGRRLFGQTMPSELPNKDIRTVREPVGVFALITPWNFPLAIPAWKIFPALVAGNTVVLKPSEWTPVCAAKFIALFEAAGFPKGVVNLVQGFGNEIGSYLVDHPEVNGVSFTGSVKTGQGIATLCAPKFKKHCLEMGGKNVIVVVDDADLDLAVDGILWASFGTTGQRCTAASRIVATEGIFAKLRDTLLARARDLRIGNGLDEDIDMGPLINKAALDKVERYVRLGKKKDNAKLLCGGEPLRTEAHKNGYFYPPTLFENVTMGMTIAQEEIFGPVVALIKAADLASAIDAANQVKYGLCASVFTSNVNAAHWAAPRLHTGLVYINTSTIGAEIQTPFGGLKNTGNGHREAGGLGGALDTYTEIKVISTDFSGKIQKAQMD